MEEWVDPLLIRSRAVTACWDVLTLEIVTY
jgi:hypothetical protein